MTGLFPDDSAARKTYPMYSGLLQYFPAALAAVANHSHRGNAKHNPGQPLHHDRAKSDDEPDALVRHLMEGDYVGCAWRALSLLQKDCEAKGAPIAPAARNYQITLADGVTAQIVSPTMAAIMLRDGVIKPDDDTGTTPAEPPREDLVQN